MINHSNSPRAAHKAVSRVDGRRCYDLENERSCKRLIDSYFKGTERPTMQGLSMALGVSRQELLEYSDKTTKGAGLLKEARARIVEVVESKLLYDKTQVVGLIFWLKNNAGYMDSQNVSLDVQGKIKVEPVYFSKPKDTAKAIARAKATELVVDCSNSE